MVQKEVDHLNWASKITQLFSDDTVTELVVETNPHNCAFGHWYYGEGRKEAEKLVPGLAPILAAMEEPHRKLHESAQNIQDTYTQADLELGNFLREKKTDHLAWAHKVKDVFVDPSIQSINAETDPHKCGLGVWMHSSETKNLRNTDAEFDNLMQELEDPHNKLHQSAAQIQTLLNEGKREEARTLYMEITKPTAYVCLDHIDQVLAWHGKQVDEMHQAENIYATVSQPMLAQVQSGLHEVIQTVNENVMTDDQMLAAASTTRQAVLFISAIALLVGVFLAYVISRGIIGPLTKGVNFAQIISGGDLTQQIELEQEDEVGKLARALNEMSVNLRSVMAGIQQAAEQVASSSNELSASSQNLANGATEQASSIEETSATVEEFTTAIEGVAENANGTDEMVAQATDASKLALDRAIKGVEQVQAMNLTMCEIQESSVEISKIIEVIDDIADQTNLLALNAAIEAARAGEAGKGFAVVADEVRKLAERSSTAAKDITNKIRDSIGKIEEGTKFASSSVDGLSSIQESSEAVRKVLDTARQRVRDISQTCNELVTGTREINASMGQLDQVTQVNSSSSEEVAASSEELSSQALNMQDMVSRFKVTNGHTEVSVKLLN